MRFKTGLRTRLRLLVLAEALLLALVIGLIQSLSFGRFASRLAGEVFGRMLEADLRSFGHYVKTYYGKLFAVDGALVDRNLVPIDGRSEMPEALKRELGVEAAIYTLDPRGFRCVVSSVAGAVGTIVEADEAPAKAAAEGKQHRGAARVLGEDYFAAYAPLLGLDEELIGLVFLGVPRSTVDRLVEAERRKSLTGLIATALAAALAAAFAAELVLGASLSPLGRLARALEELGEGGTLAARIPVLDADEIGAVAQAFNHFAERVSGGVGKASEALDSLGDASAELAEALKAVSNAAFDISSEVGAAEDAAAARLSAFHAGREESALIARESTALAARSVAMLSRASEAKRAVDGMARGLSRAAASSADAARLGAELRLRAGEGGARLAELAELSRGLSERQARLDAANSLIAEVAERTGVLALNAAIEAAHAGVYGRGFEVLAGEIRRLAEESAERSGEVKMVLGETAALAARSAEAAALSEAAFAAMSAALAEVETAMMRLDEELAAEASCSRPVLEALDAMAEEAAATASSAEASREAASRVMRGMDGLIEGSDDAAARLIGIHRSIASIEARLAAMREMGERNERGAAAVGELLRALGGDSSCSAAG